MQNFQEIRFCRATPY